METGRGLGLSVESRTVEIARAATSLMEQLKSASLDSLRRAFQCDPEFPEVLHALIVLFESRRESASAEALEDINRAYSLVSELHWDDDVDEKEWMLARLAFFAWNQGRLLQDYPAIEAWLRRCSEHNLAQEHVRNFLAIPFRDRSNELTGRYLADESVLLTLLYQLDTERSGRFANVDQESAALYQWIVSAARQAGQPTELVDYLSASVALFTVGTKLSMQHLDNVEVWLHRIEVHLRGCRGPAPLAALLEQRRLTKLYLDSSHSAVVSRIDPLITRFEELRMTENAVKAHFLKGVALREVGELEGAWQAFGEVRRRSCGGNYLSLEALAVGNSAQILGLQGRFQEALQLAGEAFKLAERSRSALCVGLAQGTVAELLRDHGDFEAAIKAYSACVISYESSGFYGFGAYTRVLAAETLLLAGQPREAASYILSALPMIERYCLTQEAVAAVGILREAVEQQQADPEALRQLCEQLQLMREHGKL